MEGRLPGWGQETMGGGDCRLKTSETGEGVGCQRHGTQPGKNRDTEGQVVSLILERKQKSGPLSSWFLESEVTERC